MSDDVTITVRVNNQTASGFRDVNGNLRDMQGRFAAAGNSMQRSSAGISQALVDVKASLMSLAPAAVPVAAAMAPIAVQAGAAGLAVAAFGAALKPQLSNLSEAAKAQDKYTQAVAKYGQFSQQAGQAQQQAAQTLAGMPKATQQAAAAYSNLREKFEDFSNSTAKFTMAPVEKSFAVLGQVIPKLTPMVEGTSTQLDRLMNVAGGAVNTSAFDALSKRVGDFANNALKNATDRAISFARALSEGNASGPIASFFEYARQQGPAVKELLTNVAEAVSNLLQGAAEAGPGLLTLVNAMAKLVAAVPPGLIANLMQVYAAFKLIKLAGAGAAAVAGGFATLSTRVAALRAASVAAGGGMAGLNAALNTLGTGGKAALAAGAVGALSLAMHELSDNKGPVAVDELATSLNALTSTGKVTGVLKSNFKDISESIAMVSKGASDNKLATMISDFGTWVGISTGPGISTAKKNVDAWDKSMANLVRSGHSKEAAAQFEILKKAWVAGGGDVDRLKKFTNDYNNAIADQKFEAQMAAESMGLFGQAAQATQAKLDAQKSSADGLRQSIEALNDTNRSALGGMIGFEASIDSAAKAAAENAGSLRMINGQLDVNSPKAQAAATALSDLASKTKDAALSARESGQSWESVNAIYERGRKTFIDSAMAMGLSRNEAKQLAGTIMNIPSEKNTRITMRTEDAVAGLNSVISAMRKTPNSKSVTVKALTADAVSMLRDLGFKVTRLKDGRFKIVAETANAKANIAAVQRARDNLKSKSITLSARDNASAAARAIQRAIAAVRGKTVTITTVRHTLGVEGTAGRNAANYRASGGLVGYAGGGAVQHFDDGGYVQGPGSGTSDSITATFASGAAARVSNSEYVVRSSAVRKYGVGLLDALNEGRLKLAAFAKGGKLTKAQQAAKALREAEKQPRATLRDQFGISHFGTMAGYRATPFEKALGSPQDMGSLVSALNAARGNIKGATHGGTESRLLRALDSAGRGLIKYEKSLSKVNASLEKAKSKLDDLKNSAAQLRDSVKSNVLSSANITRGAGSGGAVTVASIMGGLVQSRDKATAFSGALKDLTKRGLSKDLLRQVAEAGIEGGGLETAGALLGASGSEISSLNSLQAQITSAASAAGRTTADAVYSAAIKAQEKLVKSLTSQQAKLEKAMDRLAKAIEKSISRAIGKKASGGIIGAASGGARGGLTWVGEQGPEIVRLPYGSRVYSNPDSRRMATAAAGGSDQPIVINLRIGEREFGQLWVDTGRKQVRARGGIKAALAANF